MGKLKSRKFILTTLCIIVVVGLQVLGCITKTDVNMSILIVSFLITGYNFANVFQKKIEGNCDEKENNN